MVDFASVLVLFLLPPPPLVAWVEHSQLLVCAYPLSLILHPKNNLCNKNWKQAWALASYRQLGTSHEQVLKH